MNFLFSPKPIESCLSVNHQSSAPDSHRTDGYKRALSWLDLTGIGVGAVVGASIFTVTGKVAHLDAGPAVVISYLLSGAMLMLTALNYAELSSMIPVAGSAYTFTFAAFGEMAAWITGWLLMLPYLFTAASVAVGWGGYLEYVVNLISGGSINFQPKWTMAPLYWDEGSQSIISTGAYLNVAALVGPLIFTFILTTGIKHSSIILNLLMGIAVIAILTYVLAAVQFTRAENFHPFTPYGLEGIFNGAIAVFITLIGFDAVSTAAQESRNPRKDVPAAIISSLVICLLLFISTCVVLVGLLPYDQIPHRASAAMALLLAGGPQWIPKVIAFGQLCALAAVMTVCLLSQARVFQAIASDGLLPSVFANISSKTNVPVFSTLFSGIACAVLSALLPIDLLANLIGVATLLVFIVVAVAVPVLRWREPGRERGFMIPGGLPGTLVLSFISITLNCVQMWYIGTAAMAVRLIIFIVVGIIVFFCYGFHFSTLRHSEKAIVEESERSALLTHTEHS
ncbi:amino acid/polyamine transporter I [Cladochytrium replicatum]|nr:amino acid/polyamine transporter I [Cladochytrium replicatum]